MRISCDEAAISTDCEGFLCLLLRDNVQHFLEGGKPTARFAAIHALADCCWGAAEPSLTASRLKAELAEAWPLLRDVPTAKLAIGIRSRALLTGAHRPPTARGTVPLRLTGWKVPVEIRQHATLQELLGVTVARLSAFCEQAGQYAMTVEYRARALLRQA